MASLYIPVLLSNYLQVCVMVPDKRTDKEKTKMADEVLESLNDINLAKYGLSPLP